MIQSGCGGRFPTNQRRVAPEVQRLAPNGDARIVGVRGGPRAEAREQRIPPRQPRGDGDEPGERCGPPLADNRARSIGWLEIRQLQRIEWNGPLASVFRFRLRWLLTVAPRRPSKSQKNP